MKNYSVQEIAQLLDLNPETIRRWIRTGKLKADCKSRKSGNVVSENALQEFLNSYPKYAARVATVIGPFAPMVGLGVSLSGLGVASYEAIKSKSDGLVSQEQLLQHLQKALEESNQLITQNIQRIKELEQEVEREKNELQQTIKLLSMIIPHTNE